MDPGALQAPPEVDTSGVVCSQTHGRYDMATPYDLRRQLYATAREKLKPTSVLDDEELDELIEALMGDVQEFFLAKLGLSR